MCRWGVAFALGPNVNQAINPDAVGPAWQAVEMARAHQFGCLGRRGRLDRSRRDPLRGPAAGGSAPSTRRSRARCADYGCATAGSRCGRVRRGSDDGYAAWDRRSSDGTMPKGYATDIVSSLQSVSRQVPLIRRAASVHRCGRASSMLTAGRCCRKLENLMLLRAYCSHAVAHLFPRRRYAIR